MNEAIECIELEVDGKQLRLRCFGAGPIVLYVHGWAHAATCWQIANPDLTKSFTHVAIDLPGLGAAANIVTDEPFLDYAGKHVSKIISAICQELQMPLHAIVSHSLGALVALRAISAADVACDKPRLLVLLDAPLQGVSILKPLIALYLPLLAFIAVLRLLPFTIAAPIVRLAGLPTTRKISAMDDLFVRNCLAPRPMVLLNTLFVAAFADSALLTRPAVQQTVLVRGAQDWIVRPSMLTNFVKKWAAESHTFPDATHTPHLETPERFYVWLSGALTRVEQVGTDDGNIS